MLTVTINKMQLIDLICEDLTSYNNDVPLHKRVLTGSHPVPVESNNGVTIKRQDSKSALEEAANIIVRQVAEVKASEALVVLGDGHIFVRLLTYFAKV